MVVLLEACFLRMLLMGEMAEMGEMVVMVVEMVVVEMARRAREDEKTMSNGYVYLLRDSFTNF